MHGEPRGFLTSVPPTAAIGPSGGVDATAAELTSYWRLVRRPHPDSTALPVIDNDVVNCLMSDPTTERKVSLIDAAAALGAEVFLYRRRMPRRRKWRLVGLGGGVGALLEQIPDGGLASVIDRIRPAGMRPGLWLEPEVVGSMSPIACSFPDEALCSRQGQRVQEWGR
ncbi:alpha-galactosidase [Paenarthrobacter aromaticivorans]|uniref:alpha-galactosidase n=1 Tax=Paenarthrobacter aromaticivorans TaxID=2849150 RepID=UPI003A801F74